MQHQVHVLSVFDRISFKYWPFVPPTGLTQRQDNSVLLLQVIVLLNSFRSTITTQIWLSNARSIVGPLNWWVTDSWFALQLKKTFPWRMWPEITKQLSELEVKRQLKFQGKNNLSSPKNINCILYIMFIPHQKIYKKCSDWHCSNFFLLRIDSASWYHNIVSVRWRISIKVIIVFTTFIYHIRVVVIVSLIRGGFKRGRAGRASPPKICKAYVIQR